MFRTVSTHQQLSELLAEMIQSTLRLTQLVTEYFNHLSFINHHEFYLIIQDYIIYSYASKELTTQVGW